MKTYEKAINSTMTMGAEVVRIKGDKCQIGDTGYLVGYNAETNRIRIKWDVNGIRTWVKRECVEFV